MRHTKAERDNMKTVIMAGGKGTRISSVAKDIPKPMIEIAGKTVLEREIECLRKSGLTDIIITVSHLGHVIKEYFADGSRFGVHIEYFDEEKPLGNAGALFYLKDKLKEDFLLINADSIFDVDLSRFVEFHQKKNGLVTLFTHPNSHPYDSGLIFVDENKKVTRWLSKEEVRPEFYKNRVNSGLHILSTKIYNILGDFDDVAENGKIDLDRNVLKPLVSIGEVYCYDSPEYIKDMGTPERYYQVSEDVAKGIVGEKNLSNKQKAIFIDRDGVINAYKGYITDIDDFELLPEVTEAIRLINNSGFLAICVTNQPVIARGDITTSELEKIHNKMETMLGEAHAYLDAVYYCPHHPDKGFQGEIPELKIQCDCRKPKPGMLFQAAKDYNIDLAASWIIGDDMRDILAGQGAGCHTVLVGDGDFQQDISASSLLEAVNKVFSYCR